MAEMGHTHSKWGRGPASLEEEKNMDELFYQDLIPTRYKEGKKKEKQKNMDELFYQDLIPTWYREEKKKKRKKNSIHL